MNTHSPSTHTSSSMHISANHLVAWFEIPASDFKRALGFYNRVLEIPIAIRVFNGKQYGIFTDRDGGLSGAICEDENVEKRNGPVIFFRIRFDDISSVLDRVERCGGKIIMPRTLIRNAAQNNTATIPLNMIDQKIGYYAIFMDTEGNKMALYSNH